MKTRFLLPHLFKTIGWLAFLPSLLLGIMANYYGLEFSILNVRFPVDNNLTNEFAAMFLLISGFFIAFSRERIEDEWVSQVRLESLQWSVYLNYALLLLAIWAFYDREFFEVLVYNMYTILIFFIIRFNYVLRIKNRWNEKTTA
jgi:hypothetical protein